MSLKNENIESRLENIEEILKMLLVNSVLGSGEIDKIQENILNSIRDRLIMFGMENLRLNYIEDKYYIFAEIDENETLKNIKNNYLQACDFLDDIKLVLVFEKLHAKRKKAFEEAKISFYVKSDEMRIF
jgi:hypothetical protein